jgi:hypothetical protein
MQSKTINPLHFEDLEPHRFEDLIRQLVYDFRDWDMLEATGRMGTEEGFDVRGWEKLPREEDDSENNPESSTNHRIWLIQCKREKKIAPKKMANYLDEILKNKDDLYGIIFTAPCDFSKKTRDTFIDKIREKGIIEFRLWGKAEIEDQLFQPKNDHLLFTYFGFSLTINKRTMKTKIRSRLATKQKLIKLFDPDNENIYMLNPYILLRDPKAEDYPFKSEYSDFDKNQRWLVCQFKKFWFNGIIVTYRIFFGYINNDKTKFDMIDKKNILLSNTNFFRSRIKLLPDETEHDIARKRWEKVPVKNRCYIALRGLIHFDDVIAIDEKGDEMFEGFQLYVDWNSDRLFFYNVFADLEDENRKLIEESIEIQNRIKYFPNNFRRKISN